MSEKDPRKEPKEQSGEISEGRRKKTQNWIKREVSFKILWKKHYTNTWKNVTSPFTGRC